jgi:hypothetical protein
MELLRGLIRLAMSIGTLSALIVIAINVAKIAKK